MKILTLSNKLFLLNSSSVFTLVFVVSLVLVVVLTIKYIGAKEELERVEDAFLNILTNEKRISVPKCLAVEIVDALRSSKVKDMVVDIYRSRENADWVELVIRKHGVDEDIESEELEYLIAKASFGFDDDLKERVDDFIATASGKNYGKIILKYLL